MSPVSPVSASLSFAKTVSGSAGESVVLTDSDGSVWSCVIFTGQRETLN